MSEPSRCVERVCVPLVPQDSSCSLIGAVESDDVVLLGALVPRGGLAGVEFARAHDGLRWLASEWNTRAQAEHARNVAIVDCDESRLETTLPHLLSLRPQAFIGPFTNARYREYVKSSAATETMTFAPTIDDPAFVDEIDPRRRVRSCAPNLSAGVKAFQHGIDTVAKKVAADRGLGSVSDLRIYLVKTDDPADVAFAAKVEEGLAIDGKAVSSLPKFKVLSVSTDLHQSPPPSVLGPAQSMAQERPDLVVVTSSPISELFLAAVERRWDALNGTAPHPVYLTMGRWSSLEESMQSAQNKALKPQVFAVDWLGDAVTDVNYRAYAGEMLALEVRPGFGGARAVECAFTALLGGFAAASKAELSMRSITTQQWSDGVDFVTKGQEPVSLNADAIARALGLVGANPPISTRLAGTMSSALVFEGAGAVGGTPGLYCISSDEAVPARAWAPAGVKFDLSTGAENGSISCP